MTKNGRNNEEKSSLFNLEQNSSFGYVLEQDQKLFDKIQK